VFLIIVDIAMFGVEIGLGLYKAGSLLEINNNTLLKLGANYAPGVAKGEVYRVVAAIFLHINFLHILGNAFSTFILVTRVEHTFGPWKTLLMYFVSGIAGNLFSLACQPVSISLKAGASTSLYGMIGVVLGYIIINWNGLYLIGDALRCQVICTTTMLLIFVLIFTPYSSTIDYFGHIGGFLGGVWISAIH
jgi:membrane associated rhomboid family serine protease